MREVNGRILRTLLAVALLSSAGTLCNAQGTAASPAVPEAPRESEYSIEGLNLVGAAATMPLISDTLLGTESGLRRALFSEDILFRANVLPRFSVNLLDGPVPANEQVYIGQRPTWITGLNPILTADLRQLHLHDAQLNIGAAWRWTTWNPAGPKTVALSTCEALSEGAIPVAPGRCPLVRCGVQGSQRVRHEQPVRARQDRLGQLVFLDRELLHPRHARQLPDPRIELRTRASHHPTRGRYAHVHRELGSVFLGPHRGTSRPHAFSPGDRQ
jgi:hypothetical protein